MSRKSLGLALLALLSLVDVSGPLLTDGEHPPTSAIAPLIGLRAISALTAVPAFFVADVPAAAVGFAAAFIALTAAGVAMVAVPAREQAGAPAARTKAVR